MGTDLERLFIIRLQRDNFLKIHAWCIQCKLETDLGVLTEGGQVCISTLSQQTFSTTKEACAAGFARTQGCLMDVTMTSSKTVPK